MSVCRFAVRSTQIDEQYSSAGIKKTPVESFEGLRERRGIAPRMAVKSYRAVPLASASGLRSYLTLLLLAAALFLRALVPAGWMPASTGGVFAIEPCPAAGPQPMIDMAGHHMMPAGHGSSHKEHPGGDACFSALLIGFAPVDSVPVLRSTIAAPAAPLRFFAHSVAATGPPALPPPATGPPAIA